MMISQLRQGLVWLAVSAASLPNSLAFAEMNPATPQSIFVHDVELGQGGLLVGQLLDSSMNPLAGADVAIQCDGHTMASTTTDRSGVFAVAGLRCGVHQIATKDSIEVCRLWAPGTAPPRAVDQLRFVPSKQVVVRGQFGEEPHPWMHKAKTLATNPWVVGGVVATAIAVPVILNNIDDDDSGS